MNQLSYYTQLMESTLPSHVVFYIKLVIIAVVLAVMFMFTYHVVTNKHDNKIAREKNALYDKDLEIIARNTLDYAEVAMLHVEDNEKLDLEIEELKAKIALKKLQNKPTP